jgi:uncharacterized RDD family membrane protein YckC
MAVRAQQLRETITPDSFVVAPHLLGLPLAKPARRAAAMAVDLLAVALLSNAGVVLLAFAAAIVLWRASSSSAPVKSGFVKQGRNALRLAAAVLLFVGVLKAGERAVEHFGNEPDETSSELPGNISLDLSDLAVLPQLITLEKASDTTAVREAATELAQWVVSKDTTAEARAALATALLTELDSPAARSALRSALGPLASDTTVADSIATLKRERDRLKSENNALRDAAGRADDSPGFISFIKSIGDDLGIGFGWGAVYFTALLTFWKGQTLGKRLVGIRVIRLDGKPLSWWLAFERFGGYAASLSTGLLGFLQILWDRNRQGLHDKAVETVVIRALPTAADAPPLAPR